MALYPRDIFAPRLQLLLLMAASVILSGCSSEQQRPSIGVVAPIPVDALVVDFPAGEFDSNIIETLAGDLATVNPLVNETMAGSAVIGRILAGLTTLDPNTGDVIPNLAKSWDISADNLQYTFYLRRGIHWSDGQPFTADDVLFTWSCFFAKQLDVDSGEPVLDENGRVKYRYSSRSTFGQLINGQEPVVEKLDDYTVRFTTPEVYAPFLLFGGSEEILPKHVLQVSFDDGTLMDQWSVETAINEPWKIVGLNMFVLESYRPGERIVFAKNPIIGRSMQRASDCLMWRE